MRKVIIGGATLYCGDCEAAMEVMENKQFALSIVDPPYGIGASEKNSTDKKQSSKSATESKKYGGQRWDDSIPSDEYFINLKRVSREQIIWGCNYFNVDGGGRLFWDKCVTMPTYSRGELAYLSFKNSIDYFQFPWHGMIQGDMKNKETRIHPTQKPVRLYTWLLDNYAKEGHTILDTHMGSGSSVIACLDRGFKITAYEKDEEYFQAACKRIEEAQKQLRLF